MDQNQDPKGQTTKRKNSELGNLEPSSKKQCIGRFDLTVDHSMNEWEVDDEMARYAMKQLNSFIPDNELKQQILHVYPTPNTAVSQAALRPFPPFKNSKW